MAPRVDRFRAPVLASARVGLLPPTSDEVAEHFKRTNHNVVVTNKDINAWVDRTRTLAYPRPGCSPPGEPDAATDASDAYIVKNCLTPAEIACNNWINDVWAPFVRRWNNAFCGSDVCSTDDTDKGFNSFDDDIASKYDAELDQNRASFAKLASATPAKSTLSTTPIANPGTSDPSKKGSLDKLADSVTNLIWIGGVLVAIYLGTTFVLPAILGGVGATRAAYRRAA